MSLRQRAGGWRRGRSRPAAAALASRVPARAAAPNYDPYRIKVPDVVVPPFPPSNAKRTGVVFTTTDQHGHGQEPYHHHHHHQNQGPPVFQQGPEAQASEDTDPKDETFLGVLKGFFGKFKGKQGKGEGDAMMKHDMELQWLRL
ncbi:uncharacterized protein LOC113500249 [Trichoplusia ni]|uniref:Uncharacterized protein LOC113500249 n=1 Tax=Trichoplusia ni TaxID=7111 RepID=A0A7E5W8E3_TRINI|nr:uncharacterized protein LOC113500249 [Trichoplusia ni]